jgi:hypothetical protein
MPKIALLLCLLAACAAPHRHPVPESPRWLTYAGGDGPGRGKHIVLIAAEQEYRSEQSMPMLARILSARHGFDCTVLFALDRDGNVDPTMKTRADDKSVVHDIPGLEYLRTADLVIFFNRFITLPEPQMRCVIEYLDSGKPIFGIRTANHGFLGPFPYEIGGKQVRFGEDILGGTFLEHHGNWHADSTRGILVESQRAHPILRGIDDIWGPSDVYRTYPRGGHLPEGCTALVLGQPLLGRSHDDAPNPEKEPLPVAWVKSWTTSSGRTARVFHMTMGSGTDFENAGVRRLAINAAYWCLGLEDRISPASSVDIVGSYAPLETGFDYAALGVVPRPPAYYR